MAKKLLAMVLGLTMMIGAAGCSAVDTGSGSGSTKSDTQVSVSADLLDATQYKSDKEAADWTIAVVVKDGTSDWFKRMQVGVDEFGQTKTVNVIQKGPANADAASQVQLVEDMINQGVDAICIVPIDPGALESVLQKAMEKGIVVISHEASDLKNTLYDVEAFTAEDFGNTMMQELAKAMGEKGQYAQMVAYTTSTTHMEYSNAEYAYQQANYPDMSLINDTVPSAESSEKVDTAYEKGIVVISHEASDLKNTLYDVEAFTAEDFGNTMMQELAKAMGEKGQYAQMVAYTTSTTHMEYSNAEYAYQQANYPDMSLINDTVPSAESSEKVDTAYEKAKELLKANPELAGFTGAASVDILGEAQATEELGLTDKVSIVGVGTPNATREYVKNGTIDAVCLWDPASAGYAMCDLAYKILAGEEVKEGIDLGQDGYESVTIQEGANRCVLGNAPLILNTDNIDDYDF